MGKISRPRHGSLQFWPRKKARKWLPRVNWRALPKATHAHEGLQGIIGYKAGMATAYVRDKTEKSLTLNKKVAMPVTVIEIPPLRVFSVRFYKNGKPFAEQVVSQDKVLKKKLRVPASVGELKHVEGWDEIRVIVYSVTKDMFKKTPDLAEVAITSSKPFDFVKTLIGKDISSRELFKAEMVDLRGLTKGKGLSGPVARFGISLKSHKSEKGVRRPGSLAPWHPARVTFRTPMAGQLGLFSRVQLNSPVILRAKAGEHIAPSHGFKHYGPLSSDYMLVRGSVQGASKRVILITAPLRPTKKMTKKKYEFLEVRV